MVFDDSFEQSVQPQRSGSHCAVHELGTRASDSEIKPLSASKAHELSPVSKLHADNQAAKGTISKPRALPPRSQPKETCPGPRARASADATSRVSTNLRAAS
jgi:hypothetical protein